MLFTALYFICTTVISHFNVLFPAQIDNVVEVCRDLVNSASLAPGTVAPKDIGVIAAFRQQVLKLRLALRAAGLSNVSVGSVEDFQVFFCFLYLGVVCSCVWRQLFAA